MLKNNAKVGVSLILKNIDDEDKFIDLIYDVRFPEWVLVELNQL